AAGYSSRASTLSPGPGARRSACARLQEPQLPPRVLSSQQPPLPPREENLLTTRGLRTTTPSKHRAASLSAPSTGHAGALGSVNKPGWRRLDAVPYGICSFCLLSWAEEQPRFQSAADKRAHHNALERKRRDHIKDSFHSLRDSVPSLQGEKASRAQILDKATEYIQYMRRKNHTHQQDIDDLKRQNALLEQQVRALEKARSSAQLQTNYPSSDSSLYTNAKGSTISAFDGGSDSSSESEPEEPQSRKKLRMEAS
uniref:Uncharacterized protein n=1 Tax=Ovis aries TaxID=9940 RepID=A0AC11CRY0_SHEEP